MNTPILSAFNELHNKRPELFRESISILEEGLANKHIWNFDFEDAKTRLSRVWEKAESEISFPIRQSYYKDDLHIEWGEKDPRHNMGLVSLSNAASYLEKLKKVKGAPELAPYIELFSEGAKIGELIKTVKPYIVKGRKPSENPKEVDLTNTGICSVCGRRQKLSMDGFLVDHGYSLERNWGGRSGICYGAKHKAWELSPEGAIAYKKVMETTLIAAENTLEGLKLGKFNTLSEMVSVRIPGNFRTTQELRTYDKGTPEYSKVLRSEEIQVSTKIAYLQDDIETFTHRIANWKAEPLKYGGAETQERWKSRLLK